MREVDVSRIKEAVKQACGEMAVYCSSDILEKLKERRDAETGRRSKIAMEMLVENAELAAGENIPICQDTGLVTVYVTLGQEVHLAGGSLKEAIQ